MAPKFDVPRLHELFMAGEPYREIGRAFGVGEASARHKVDLLRRKEGTDRWPLRTSPSGPQTGDPSPSRARPLRPGEPTLPPLASLRDAEG